MLRVVRWGFAIVGALMLARAGITIFHTPRHEVLFSTQSPLRACVPKGCTTLMLLEVGNAGSKDQDNVRVRLRAEPLRNLQLPLKVRNFGTVDRPVKMTEADGQRVYDLGRLEPQKRVELRIVFVGKPDETAPAWDEILVGVEASQGEAHRGDPSLVQFARYMQAIFGWL